MPTTTPTLRNGRRWAAAGGVFVILLSGLVFTLQPDGASGQVAPPPVDHDIKNYVLFAHGQVLFKGGNTGAGNRGIIDGGNVGANGFGANLLTRLFDDPNPLYSGEPAVAICSNGTATMSDDTQMVGPVVRFTSLCDVWDAFIIENIGEATGVARNFEGPFEPPVIDPLPPFPQFQCDPTAPDLIVGNNATGTASPGSYNQIIFRDGSTVTMEPGLYTSCSFQMGNGTATTSPGVVMHVQANWSVGGGTFSGPDCEGIPLVFVRGQGIGANDNSINFSVNATDAWGHFYAESKRIALGNGSNLHGTFWAGQASDGVAARIGSDFNVNIEYCAPPLGSLEITKQISGDTDGYVPDTTFQIAVDCDGPGRLGEPLPDQFDQVLSVEAGETVTVGSIPLGSTCTATEVGVPPPVPGFEYEPAEITPESVVINSEVETFEIVVDNPLRETFGTLEVSKAVSGATAAYPPGSLFNFTLDCDNDTFDTTFQLAAGDTFTSDPIRVSTTCTVLETAAPTPAPGFGFGTPVFTPNPPTVTITEEEQVVTVAVVNPLVELSGQIQVTKTVTGATAGYTPGALFSFALDCNNDAFDTTFQLAAGAVFTSGPIRVGTTCTVSETATPPLAAGFQFGAPVFTPNPPTVTITQANQVVTFAVANPISDTNVAAESVDEVEQTEDLGESEVPTLVVTGAATGALVLIAVGLVGVGLLLASRRARRRAGR